MGAGRVVGVDIDPEAVATASANARLNCVDDVQFMLPEATPEGAFDLVVANILARPLVTLAPLLISRVKPGGRIALAGLLEAQADAIAAAYAPACRMSVARTHDGWALLAGVREG
jgi:ribosomal protein L11 methyltransferase